MGDLPVKLFVFRESRDQKAHVDPADAVAVAGGADELDTIAVVFDTLDMTGTGTGADGASSITTSLDVLSSKCASVADDGIVCADPTQKYDHMPLDVVGRSGADSSGATFVCSSEAIMMCWGSSAFCWSGDLGAASSDTGCFGTGCFGTGVSLRDTHESHPWDGAASCASGTDDVDGLASSPGVCRALDIVCGDALVTAVTVAFAGDADIDTAAIALSAAAAAALARAAAFDSGFGFGFVPGSGGKPTGGPIFTSRILGVPLRVPLVGVATSAVIVGVLTELMLLFRVLACLSADPPGLFLLLVPLSVRVDDLRDSVRPPTSNVSPSAPSGFRGSYRPRSAVVLGFDVPPDIVSRATCVDAEDLGARGQDPYQLRVFYIVSSHQLT